MVFPRQLRRTLAGQMSEGRCQAQGRRVGREFIRCSLAPTATESGVLFETLPKMIGRSRED